MDESKKVTEIGLSPFGDRLLLETERKEGGYAWKVRKMFNGKLIKLDEGFMSENLMDAINLIDKNKVVVKDTDMAKKTTAAVNADSGQSLKEIMSGLEKQVIQQTLDKHGSVNKASEVLGINRTTLFRKMR